MITPTTRAKLRRNPFVRNMLAWWFSGVRSAPHPHAPYTLYFNGAHCLGWSMGDLANWESREFLAVKRLLARLPVTVAWDIGANVGAWSLFLAGLHPQMQVISFEPDPENVRLLELNRKRNQIDRIVIRELALSDSSGKTTFYADRLSGSTGSLIRNDGFTEVMFGVKRRPINVQMSTIDAEVAGGTQPPEFIKIDVEGHELSVLRGARETLSKYRPSLLLEVSMQAGGVADLLRSHGYLLISPETDQPVDAADFMTLAVPQEVFERLQR